MYKSIIGRKTLTNKGFWLFISLQKSNKTLFNTGLIGKYILVIFFIYNKPNFYAYIFNDKGLSNIT